MNRTLCGLCALLLAACADTGEVAEEGEAARAEQAEVVVVRAEAGPSGLLPPATGPGAWALDRAGSAVMFTGRQGEDSFTGRFGRFDAAIVFDPDDLPAASIAAAVDLGSVDAGTSDRNESLPEPDWFDIARYPRARFVSERVRQVGEGRYVADGTLTLKGIAQPVSMPFTLDIEGDRAVADAKMALDRSVFGVGEGEFASPEWVGTEVAVSIHVEAERAFVEGGQ